MRIRLEPLSLESTLIQRYNSRQPSQNGQINVLYKVDIDVDMSRSEQSFTRVHLRLKSFRNFFK